MKNKMGWIGIIGIPIVIAGIILIILANVDKKEKPSYPGDSFTILSKEIGYGVGIPLIIFGVIGGFWLASL